MLINVLISDYASRRATRVTIHVNTSAQWQQHVGRCSNGMLFIDCEVVQQIVVLHKSIMVEMMMFRR